MTQTQQNGENIERKDENVQGSTPKNLNNNNSYKFFSNFMFRSGRQDSLLSQYKEYVQSQDR